MYRIGIDLGGTNIAAGVVDEGQHIVAEVSLPTGAERCGGVAFQAMTKRRRPRGRR